MWSRIKTALRWTVDSYVLFVAIGLVLGAFLVPVALGTVGGPDGTVAVIPIDGTIDGQQAVETTAMLQEARQDPDVKAVVLVANSGGGSAAASEELYMEVKRTSEELPVVAAVDGGAASGAYYAIAPSDRIYVKPSSTVGSVGVFVQLPDQLEPNDLIATTGPRKIGADERDTFYEIETLQRAFSGAVVQHRDDELELTREELEHGDTYVGAEAVENGVADEIGNRQAAVRHASSLANLDRPSTTVLTPAIETRQFLIRGNYLASTDDDREMLSLTELVGNESSGQTYLMVSGDVIAGSSGSEFVGPNTVAAIEDDAESDLPANESSSEAPATDTDPSEDPSGDETGDDDGGDER